MGTFWDYIGYHKKAKAFLWELWKYYAAEGVMRSLPPVLSSFQIPPRSSDFLTSQVFLLIVGSADLPTTQIEL
ncbi:MAG: hypothetical protein A2583_13085 [Bdellovibrionales bacterium RIFOXYD1_FULL_53_11]|nr:MAG: hypothetical protein A2583_13085 [Bdellovibrionales bacterium RIFOXYD1_FULL_53_11]